jgi:hypothetical protein
MKKLENWFKKNDTINIGKTVAMFYHTKQSKFLMRPTISCKNTDIELNHTENFWLFIL